MLDHEARDDSALTARRCR